MIKTPTVPDAVKAQYPSHMPSQVVTSFNEALACMDDLMLVNRVAPLRVASDGILNYTSSHAVSNGGKEMLISALSRMSVRSKGVQFIAYGSDIQGILALSQAHPDQKEFAVPDYFIRGGVTQYLKNLWSGNEGDGASVSIDDGDLIDHGSFYSIINSEDISSSNSNSATYQAITLDMSVGRVSTLAIIPGVSTANTLAISGGTSNSKSFDMTIGDFGYSYNISSDIGSDINQAYRSLIQVGAIELIGKLQGLPYWRCLANAGTVEETDAKLRAEFAEQYQTDRSELTRFVQKALHELEYYDGEVDGVLDMNTRAALQKYQQHMGLLATGLIGYDTFRMLNTFTPTRDSAYAPWWQHHTPIPELITAHQPSPSEKK